MRRAVAGEAALGHALALGASDLSWTLKKMLWLQRNSLGLFGAHATAARTSRFSEVLGRNEGNQMRIFLAFAITMAAAIGLGGCFWHHQQAVVTQPAPPLK
jgi:hypothetical protein